MLCILYLPIKQVNIGQNNFPIKLFTQGRRQEFFPIAADLNDVPVRNFLTKMMCKTKMMFLTMMMLATCLPFLATKTKMRRLLFAELIY